MSGVAQVFGCVRASVAFLLVMTLLFGGVYPLVVTVLGQLAFHHAADGSLIEKNGKVVGSELLAQSFSDAKYFWSRPSATTPPYNAASSSGSNLSPANPALHDAVKARVAALKKADPGNHAKIPVDLVTASASGLDPHISLAAAEYQLKRVARARGMKESDVRKLVEKSTQGGMLSDAYVNVLELNLALDGK